MTTEPTRTDATWRWHLAVLAGFGLVAVVMTWPLAAPGAGVVPDVDDTFFSIWRLAWVAHQLVRDPAALFDANIFYPAEHTLAYSDAMLLVGLAGAPLYWMGAPPWAIHNGLLLAALATSAWATAALALRLTGDRAAALLAGLIAGFAPYRIAHIGHLELQWLVWMPLALLALHALVAAPSVRRGLAVGGCLAAQLLCSIYYGVFLAAFAGVAWLALVWAHGARPRLVASTMAAAVPLALVAGPYLLPYAASRHAHPPRSAVEVAQYSATPADYLRAAPYNLLRGRHEEGPAPEERSLYPGAAAIVLALAAGLWTPRRTVAVYAVLALLAFDASLGVNGLGFRGLQTLLPPLANLRAPARFASLGLVALAVLAAFGVAAIRARVRAPAARAAVVALAAAIGLTEYWSAPIPTRDARLRPMPVDAWLRTLPDDAVILELPVPRLDRLWLYEVHHEVRSIHHWRRLLNGYSGFLPTAYANTLADLETFPDERSVARLQRLSVDYVVVRRVHTDGEAFLRLDTQLKAVPAFGPPLAFGTGADAAAVYPLRPAAP